MCNFKITSRLLVVLFLIFLVIGWKATVRTPGFGNETTKKKRQ